VDREEFTSFYAASFPRLVGQLYAMTGDRAEAQDAVQEAFVRAWSHRGQLDRDGAPDAWVRATAWRIAASSSTNTTGHGSDMNGFRGGERRTRSPDKRSVIRDFLGKLPPHFASLNTGYDLYVGSAPRYPHVQQFVDAAYLRIAPLSAFAVRDTRVAAHTLSTMCRWAHID